MENLLFLGVPILKHFRVLHGRKKMKLTKLFLNIFLLQKECYCSKNLLTSNTKHVKTILDSIQDYVIFLYTVLLLINYPQGHYNSPLIKMACDPDTKFW